jgi:peptidoglycan/xylan/chitin deacetylase (PgdA/CDA1 family)
MTRLPILMYHNVTSDKNKSKGLTIFYENLENQFRYLVENNYTTFHFSELEKQNSVPPNSIVITFDDVTYNQLVYAVPLLVKYNLKATFFIPFSYLNKTDFWNGGTEKIMSIEQLKSLDARIELGLHSFEHKRYDSLSNNQINDDFEHCRQIITKNNLVVYNALAYPYGNYPKKEPRKTQFQVLLKKNKIKMGLRIGNKVNKFPFKNPYEIMRIDIKGEDSMLKFKLKLRFGKLNLF